MFKMSFIIQKKNTYPYDLDGWLTCPVQMLLWTSCPAAYGHPGPWWLLWLPEKWEDEDRMLRIWLGRLGSVCNPVGIWWISSNLRWNRGDSIYHPRMGLSPREIGLTAGHTGVNDPMKKKTWRTHPNEICMGPNSSNSSVYLWVS